MAKMITRRAVGMLGRWIALALPAFVFTSSLQRTALARAEPECGSVVVREIDGRLYFSEPGGTWAPVPDGPAAEALRETLRASSSDGALAVDVGRTVVADGGSGWHGSRKSP
jgi:hypothetical protein